MAIGSSVSEPGEPIIIPPPFPIPRYGPETWGPWREVGMQLSNPRSPRILQLDGRQRVSGYSDKGNGELFSIVTRSLDGKEERAGKHKPFSYLTLREFDGSTLTLSHLSGEEKGNWSVCFHYH